MTHPIRVAVTGMGVRAPGAHDVDELWATLLSGKPQATLLTRFNPRDQAGLDVDFGCEVTGFDDSKYLSPKEASRMDRATRLGYTAMADAIADADNSTVDSSRCAVVFGTAFGGFQTIEDTLAGDGEAPNGPGPAFIPKIMSNAAAAAIAMKHEFLGPSSCVSTQCASGAYAIGQAAQLIRAQAADYVVAGASEAAMTPAIMLAFQRAGALSRRSADPAAASRPFDTDRDGFVMAEGSGALVLERWDLAEARGATIHAELAGFGFANDAYRLVAPHPQGRGARLAMEAALADAGAVPSDVAHVNAHGTSTKQGDTVESLAISSVFGDHRPCVTSSKSILGHTLGAAGMIEAVASILSLRDGIVHPTANTANVDPACDIDVVTCEAREIPKTAVLSNSFGFGGHCAALAFRPGTA